MFVLLTVPHFHSSLMITGKAGAYRSEGLCGATTLSITTLNKMGLVTTLSIMGLVTTLSINVQHNSIECHFAECRYTECRSAVFAGFHSKGSAVSLARWK